MPPKRQIDIRGRGVIMCNDTLLVVRHRPHVPHYCLPGGHLEWGEDPQECVVREISEELGVTPEIGRLLFVHTFYNDAGTETVEFIFEVTNGAEYAERTQNAGSHAHEIIEQRWLAHEDAVTLVPTALHTAFKEGTLLSDTPRFITYPPARIQ